MSLRLFPALVILPYTLGLFSCNSSANKNSGKALTANLNDSLNYISIADAQVFLQGWSKENVVVYHCIAEPDILHPTNGTSAMRTEIFQYTQMYLVRLDHRTLQPAPALLTEMPVSNDDGTSYTCELRNEVRWDNGSPLTATDVIFTAKANSCPLTDNPHAKPYWENLLDIIPDDNNPLKFTVVMKKPYMHNVIFWGDWPIMQRSFFDSQGLLDNFTLQQFADLNFNASSYDTLSRWANEYNSSKYSREPQYLTGLGMYKIDSWDPGISVTLERKQNHWTRSSTDIYETSYPDKIIFRVNKDPNSQVLDFKSQVLDGSINLSTKTLLQLQNDSIFSRNYNSKFTDSFNYTYIAMNMRPDGIKHRELFTDKRVRRAMALLTPVDEMNRIINRSMNKRMTGPVSFLKKDYDTTLRAVPYDPSLAIQLLKDAGWQDTDGNNIADRVINGEKVQFEFEISYMTNTPDWKDYATLAAEAYAQAGLKANLKPLDFSVFVGNARKHDFDMMIGVWGQSAFPEDFTQLWHTSSWMNEGTNYPGFGNAQTDALIDSIKAIPNADKRRPLVIRFQRIVYDEQPFIFLFSSLRKNVIHRRFGNTEMYFERPGILINNLKHLTAYNEITP